MDWVCKKKRWFMTKDAAKRKINKLKQLNKHCRLEPYHCKSCDGWHLTSKVSMSYKVKSRSRR